MNRKLKIKSYNYILIIVAIVAAILVNLIATTLSAKLPLQLDLTGNEVFKLSEETVNVLEKVDKDINIYYFVTSGREELYVKQTVDMYKGHSDKIHFEQKDPAQDPAFTKSIGSDITDNSVVVKCGDRKKIIDYSSLYDTTFQKQGIVSFQLETKLTAAIDYVLRDKDTNVVFTMGHEEVGMNLFKDILDSENATVSEVDLKTADIPENTSVLYIIGPKRDFSSDELKKIDAYVKKGGNLNVSLDYGSELPLFMQFMDEYYGVKFENNIIMETVAGNILANNPFWQIPAPADHEITSDMLKNRLAVIMPESRSITVTEKLGIEATSLYVTSPQAVAKAPAEEVSTSVESGDIPMSYTLAAVLRVPLENNKWSKILVTGTSLYAANMFLQEASVANADFIRNSYNYLHGSKISSLAITPKNIAVNYLVLNQQQIITYAIVFGIIPPVLILGFGIFVWFKRRHL